MNNPVSCETALTVNAVSVAGNTTVPLIVCKKGTFSYVDVYKRQVFYGKCRKIVLSKSMEEFNENAISNSYVNCDSHLEIDVYKRQM